MPVGKGVVNRRRIWGGIKIIFFNNYDGSKINTNWWERERERVVKKRGKNNVKTVVG